jgi:hypothetical protein
MFRRYICSHDQAGYRILQKKTIKYNTIKTVATTFRLYINAQLNKNISNFMYSFYYYILFS